VRTAEPVIDSQMRLVQFPLAFSPHLSFVFKLSEQTVAMTSLCNEECADIHHVYGYCDGNTREAVEE